jgi:hypothetical protein
MDHATSTRVQEQHRRSGLGPAGGAAGEARVHLQGPAVGPEIHRQGAQDLPSFNACRETCREIAYHYNLLALPAPQEQAARRLKMMGLLVRHLALFVGGKLEVEVLLCVKAAAHRIEG